MADTLWINQRDRNPSWSTCLADAPRIGHIHHHLSRLPPAQPLPTAFGPALVARALQMPRRMGHEAAFVRALSELPTAEIRTLLLIFVNKVDVTGESWKGNKSGTLKSLFRVTFLIIPAL